MRCDTIFARTPEPDKIIAIPTPIRPRIMMKGMRPSAAMILVSSVTMAPTSGQPVTLRIIWRMVTKDRTSNPTAAPRMT